ncbi:hypothetical protein K1T71_000340 [Dendrolimus kikuchii]|uniref:Uncharacterized protein n=1 Tax=Dendrolimus kikuchii TaxID=765133 RepID=A0ACC1DJ35_9NEOP|nr:hypothetical protein K1T71_000340 [Dendrolimus kikuchii]
MEVTKYLTVLVVLCLEGGETGGHGEKHHDHVRLHIPEFIHHDYHKKVITIHHHHHKPKKEHHHHHHHHHKPQIPPGHHYHHHHKKSHTTSHSSSKGHQGHHGHHKHHGHHVHHGHHSHNNKHNHHGHGHTSHHHDTPSTGYDPASVPFFEDNTGPSYPPSVPDYGAGTAHQIPKVHGVTHTVKQVKVYDSLPGVIPGKTGSSDGYEVTEHGEEDDEDIFTSVNGLQQVYPATYGYLRSAGAQPPSHDPFVELTAQNAIQPQNNNNFEAAFQPAAVSGLESTHAFTGSAQSDPFSSSAPVEHIGVPNNQPSVEFPAAFQNELSLDNPAVSFTGTGSDGTAFTAGDEGFLLSDKPVSFAREAGIQQTTNTGGVETIVY